MPQSKASEGTALPTDERPAVTEGRPVGTVTGGRALRTNRNAMRIAATSRYVPLSEREADAILRALDGDRSTKLLADILDRRGNETGPPEPHHPHSLSELAILGHEIIQFLRDRIEATREMGGARVEAAVLMLGCDFVLRTSLDGEEDRAVVSALLRRAQAIVHS